MESDFPPFNEVVETRFGRMIANVNDLYIGRSLREYGEFSFGKVELFQQVLQPGGVVLEIGANVGAHTIALAKSVGRTGRVIAFEPQRIAFQALCGSLAINSITNVEAHCAAVGKESGELLVPQLVPNAQNNFGGLALGTHAQGERVPLKTIDSLGLKRCNLIKVDVEGMEEDVLRGGEQTIRSHRPILYFESDRDEKRSDLVRYVDSLDYAMYWHLPLMFHAGNFRGVTENVFPGIVSKNILGVSRQVQQRIEGLRPVEIP